MKSRQFFIFGILILCSVSLFSYHLFWGSPYFFHPDERNIAYSVSGLIFPTQLNPHFFAYGSLPIYAIYLLALIKNLVLTLPHNFSFSVSLADAIIASRLLSDFFAVASVILLFNTGKKLHGTKTGLLASFLGIFSIGFIQFAHFGTFEMWLTFFYLLLFYRFLFFLDKKTFKNFFYLLVISGVLVAIKISSLVLLLIPFLAVVMLFKQAKEKKILLILKLFLLSMSTLLGIFLCTNPFVFLDFSSFLSSIHYESSVATGVMPVFYTGGFFGTIPVLYQLLHVYPFLLNPLVLLMGIISLIILLVKKHSSLSYRTLVLFFLIYFLSQAFLFVKWTRYLMPTLPFFYLAIASLFIEIKTHHSLFSKLLWHFCLILCVGSSLLWSTSYFITAFIHPDTRIAALTWAKKHIPQNSRILTESYDLGTLPFQSHFPNVTAFNFYDLDTTSYAQVNLKHLLANTDFLLLPSQRVIKNRLTNPLSFPVGNTFYATLIKGKTFEKVYETPCDIFCQITYLGDPVFHYEETASVFDRPTVQIYKVHEK